MKKSYTVDEAHTGWRLDRFLVTQLPDLSRSAIQKLITNAHVLVNDKKVTKHHFLSTDDQIQVDLEVAIAPIEEDMPVIPVLYEDDDILVIEKPMGLLVHAAPHTPSHEKTLVDFLRMHVPGVDSVGENNERPGIVHRLDREVSGVMITTKTQVAFKAIKKQFQEHTVGKEYRAIVHGVLPQTTGVIDMPIARSKTHGAKMAALPQHTEGEGRQAHTEYTVLETYKQRYSFLAVKITTGRTHQIRAHLAAIDHPVVGDKLYMSKHYGKKTYPRLFLHSHKLEIQHPITKETMQFESPVPESFPAFLSS